MNGYIAGNAWARFVRTSGRTVKSVHVSLMAACYQIANEEKWVSEFQLPTKDAMELSCIRDKETFYRTLKELVSFGAITILEESKNIYTARWVTFDNLAFYLSELPTATPTTKPIGTPTATPTTNRPNNKSKESNKRNEKDIVADGIGSKQNDYDLSFNALGIATCQVLRQTCVDYRKEHLGLYSDDMFADFIKYWSEPNEKKVPRWYTEKTRKGGRWNLPGRLSTWSKNNKQKFNNSTQPVTNILPDQYKLRKV